MYSKITYKYNVWVIEINKYDNLKKHVLVDIGGKIILNPLAYYFKSTILLTNVKFKIILIKENASFERPKSKGREKCFIQDFFGVGAGD